MFPSLNLPFLAARRARVAAAIGRGQTPASLGSDLDLVPYAAAAVIAVASTIAGKPSSARNVRSKSAAGIGLLL
jgi:hypothetical protein